MIIKDCLFIKFFTHYFLINKDYFINRDYLESKDGPLIINCHIFNFFFN